MRALLLTISADESRHAELAFRFVKWALSQGDHALARDVRAEFAALAGEFMVASVPSSALEIKALRHGIVPDAMRAAIRQQALREVILPCASALLDDRGQQHLVAAANRQHVRVTPGVMNAVGG